ncbi:GGDEF domain-containing protein [Thalassomonas viridans]|uniref:diguanylate cyclase n=1 Tax=Thalassomonas viridans TaxID=137584 RepID=A0AAF0C7M2_9GAMM|nr:GGDEF domain-containing protein [Thalassomonas viridans]WDE03315.1 GGDEF domain-containing protein [Thalassomonas viridans]
MKRITFGLLLLLSTTFTVKAESSAHISKDFDEQLQYADKIRSSDPELSNTILLELQKHEELLTAEQQHYLKYLLAYQLTFQGTPDKGLKQFKELAESKASKSLKFRTNITIINTLANTQKWNEGLAYLSKALELLPSIENKEIMQTGLMVAANFYNQLGQYELGYKYAEKLNLLPINDRNLCLSKGVIIEAKINLELLAENSDEIKQGIEICDKVGETLMSSFIRSFLVRLHLNKQQPDKALNILLPNLEVVENSHYPRLIIIFYSSIAKAYSFKQNYIQSEKYALKTIAQAELLGASQPVVQAYEILYKIAEQRKEFQLALKYHVNYTKANKTYLDNIKTKHLAYQLAEHQAIEQETRIKLLNEQNKLLRVEQDLAQAEAENNKLFISLLIALSTLLIFWAYKSRLTQKRLRQMAEYDSLTGIYNRGHFTQLARSSLEYCQSSNLPLSCILFDLDKFKTINDNYGHACGDWVLKKTADVCRNIGRKNDIFVRLGGEEFCIFLPGCDLTTAKEFAELCRQEVAAIDSTESGFSFDITASFGLTSAKLSGFDLDKIIADADQAMYLSKNNGRNRITLFTP